MSQTPAFTLTLRDTSGDEKPQRRHADKDVIRAETEFITLERQLSNHSKRDYHIDLTKTSAYKVDLEKGEDDISEDDFDLREYLQSSNDANQAAGIRHKKVGVVWEDLQVEVPGGEGDSRKYVPTLADAALGFLLSPFNISKHLLGKFVPAIDKPEPTKPIIHKASGVLRPGEMCLVLGCPGGGCTTFLKSIANRRQEYAKVTGTALYAGISAEDMDKHYKGEIVYNQEDDVHIPTLTVGQTLDFALSTKTPGPNGRLPGMSRKDFDREVQETLLRMLNISHTKDTLVGNEFVRGVSGGERKRVSIAEMMATRARLQCWDNSTRGLDASTALDFVRALRVMTDVLGQTTFVTLYQASESIYELFDKVLVLDKGRQVYFGPTSQARAYFEGLGYKSLPRQTTPDYLTGCTDPNERQFAPGRSAQDTPSTPEALETAYLYSAIGKRNRADVERYKIYMQTEKEEQEAFRAAVAADKKKGVSKKSPYTLGFFSQVGVLTKRQFVQRRQDKFHGATGWLLAIALSFIIGTAYYDIPTTSSGAFVRGSVIFATLLNTSLEAFSEMPLQMFARPILRKQTDYSMYRPSAISLANLVSDMPFSSSKILVYNMIIYLLSGLHRSAGGFFSFYFINWVSYLTMQAFFRFFGLLCFDFYTATRYAALFIPNFVQYCGYTIPVASMKRWLFWIYHINPLSYSWQMCMMNEFKRVSFTCDGTSVIPRNAGGILKYPDELGVNQVCTLFGAKVGSSVIPGRDYLQAGFGLNVDDLWRRNFPILLVLFFTFQLGQFLALEFYPQWGYTPSVQIYINETEELRRLNSAQRAKRNQKLQMPVKNGLQPVRKTKGEKEERHDFKDRRVFTWEKLNYHVPVPGGTRRILHDVYGYVKPGTLTALMGSSGAGKTSCLDVLAQRKNIGVITGDMLVDGRPLPPDFARATAYAEQMDVHEGTSTVRESLRFSAYLRQPESVSKEEKDAYVEEIIELLELQDLSEALVLSLGVEARKRVTIGVELASKPELLLFLDEPTSGLDGQSAWNLVRFLRKLADQGQAILCTIHQPSAMLFENFDRLLLLTRGGETVYFGDIGKDSQVIREYLARYGAFCPPNANPAEYMLEAVGAGVTPRVGDKEWKDIWRDSPELRQVKQEIQALKSQGLARPELARRSETYAASFLTQVRHVAFRNAKALWRTPNYIFTRLFVCTFISLFVSLSFLQLGNSVRDLQFRVFALYWVTVVPIIIMNQIAPLFIMNRAIFVRESSSRIYSPYVFAIGQVLGEIPYSILCGILYWIFMAFPIGLGDGSAGSNGVGFQLLIVIFMVIFGVTMGQVVGSLSSSIDVAIILNPFITVVLATFCGVLIPFPSMGSWWRSWMYYLDPYTRTLSAMISTELHGLTIRCRPDEFAIFNPPDGQTCAEWAGEFANRIGGYLDNPLDTAACRYCQFKVGDEFYTYLNMSFDHRWRDAFVLFSFIIFNILFTIVASRVLRFARR